MTLYQICLSALIFVSAAFMVRFALNESKVIFRIVAGTFVGLGIAIAALPILQQLRLSTATTEQFAGGSRVDQASDLGFASLRLDLKNDSPRLPVVISLDREKVDLNQLHDRTDSDLILLDASAGVLPENLKALQSVFKDLSVEGKQAAEKVNVCWQRSQVFAFASGICHPRMMKWSFAGSEDDVSRTSTQRSAAKMIQFAKKRLLLVSYEIPAQKKSVEEMCWATLMKGEACAAVEILPSAAISALNITSQDPIVHSVLSEYGVMLPKSLNESLNVYAERDSARIDSSKMGLKMDQQACFGLTIESGLHLTVSDLSELGERIRIVDSESKLATEARNLTEFLQCPGVFSLSLSKFQHRESRISARSFMTYAMAHSFWFTDAKSYLSRVRKVQRVGLTADVSKQKIRVESLDDISGLSLTFVLPRSYPEELLQNLQIQDGGAGSSVYRMGDYAFRVSLNHLAGKRVVDLENMFSALVKKSFGLRPFLSSSSAAEALQLAYLIAFLLSFVHITASRRSADWVFTFGIVFSIGFVLVFLSLMSSRLPSSADLKVAQLENPPLPQHIFMRDWPDEWFKVSDELAEKQAVLNQKISAKWNQVLTNAKKSSDESGGSSSARQDESKATFVSGHLAGALEGLSQADLFVQASPGQRAVVFWDHPATRNFYFRRSSVYQSIVLGWRELIAAHPQYKISSEASIQKMSELAANTILVMPDIRFIADVEEGERISQFVKSGGTLLFSEKLALEEASEQFQGPAEFVEMLKKIGMTRSKAAQFSRVSLPEAGSVILNSSHRSLTDSTILDGVKWGDGNLIFVGVQPIDGSSRSLYASILEHARGETRTVRDVGGGCATALLVQPWAASASTLAAFADSVKASGYDLKWLVDAVSLAKMAPTWEGKFRQNGVVFLDDGKTESRRLAIDVLKSLMNGADVQPMFAAGHSSVGASSSDGVGGVYGTMFQYEEVASTDSHSMARQLVSECSLGVARPRLLSGGVGQDDWQKRARALRENAPKGVLGLQRYVDRLTQAREMKRGNQEGPVKVIGFDSSNPLQFKVEHQ